MGAPRLLTHNLGDESLILKGPVWRRALWTLSLVPSRDTIVKPSHVSELPPVARALGISVFVLSVASTFCPCDPCGVHISSTFKCGHFAWKCGRFCPQFLHLEASTFKCGHNVGVHIFVWTKCGRPHFPAAAFECAPRWIMDRLLWTMGSGRCSMACDSWTTDHGPRAARVQASTDLAIFNCGPVACWL